MSFGEAFETEGAGLFEIDYDFCDVELLVGDKVADRKPRTLTHRLRKPTFDELHRRSQLVINEEISQSDTETEPIYSDDKANNFLYDQIVQAVRGYRTGKEDGEGWTRDPEFIRGVMTSPHKSKAVSALYSAEVQLIEDDDGDGLFPLVGAAEICIELTIADQFKTRHYLQAPTEAQWSALQSKRVQTRQRRGQKRQHFTYQVNIAPARDFFDALLVRMEGVKLRSGVQFSPTDRAQFLAQFDAIHKQLIVNKFCEYWGGKLRD